MNSNLVLTLADINAILASEIDSTTPLPGHLVTALRDERDRLVELEGMNFGDCKACKL